MAKEHELLTLGGHAAAAAHSLGTPLSTIKIITQDLIKQFKGQKDIEKDIETSLIRYLKILISCMCHFPLLINLEMLQCLLITRV